MDFMKLKATLSLDSSEYEQGLNDSEGKAKGFKAKFGKVMKGAAVGVAAITTATAAVGGAFVKATGSVAEYGDHIDKMSQKMGLSAEKYQEWDAILQHSGTSIDTMKASMKTLANAVESGNEAFQRIGLTQEQIANMSQEELFEATISGLQNVEDTTERTYLAGKLLGRGATELGALLNTSAEDTEAMRQRVHELGGVMSDEAVKASARYTDSLQDMQTAMDGAKRNIVSSFLPSIADVMDGLGNLFSGDSDKGIGQISGGIDKFIKTMTSAIPKVLSVGGAIVSALGQAIIKNLPVLLDAGVKALMQIIKGIATAMPQLIPAIVNAVLTMAGALIDNVDLIVNAAIQLALGIGEGLIRALPEILAALGSLLTKIVEKFGEVNWVSVGLSALKGVLSGMQKIIPSIISAVRGAVQKVLRWLGFNGAAKKVGQAFESISKTISDKLDAAKKKVSDWIDKIKGMFPFNIGKIFSGWVPKISLKTNKSGDSASTSSTVGRENFAKAMNQPYMFKRPTEFYAGDAGDEVLYGRKSLMKDIKDATSGNGDVIINLNYDADADATDMLRDLVRGVQRYKMAGAI